MNHRVPFIMSVLVANAAPANADETAVRAEVERLLANARELAVNDTPVHLVVEERIEYFPPEPELSRRIAAAEGKPEHPDAHRIQGWLRRQAGIFQGIRREFFIGGGGILRIATDFDHKDTPDAPPLNTFSDFAITPRSAWILDSENLTRERLVRRGLTESRVNGVVNMLLFGSGRSFADTTPDIAVDVQGDTARVTVHHPDRPTTIAWTLTDLPGHGWTLTRSAIPESAARLAKPHLAIQRDYADHDDFGFLSHPVARTVVIQTRDGQIDRRFHVRDAAPIARDQVLALVAEPSASTPDPIRGWNDQEVTDFTAPTAIPSPTERPSPAPSEPTRTGNTGRIAIVGVVVGVAAVIAVIIVNRTTRAGA